MRPLDGPVGGRGRIYVWRGGGGYMRDGGEGYGMRVERDGVKIIFVYVHVLYMYVHLPIWDSG